MARKPRIDAPGIHHVWARGNDRQDIFRDTADRQDYLRLLGLTVLRKRWRCLAYCLMDNHVHLLLETQDANLAAGMQWLHGVYASTINDRRLRSGHIFQGRYGSKPVTDDEQLWTAIAYIVHNPVRAGLCEKPGDWRWSSHAAIVRGPAPRWLDRERLLEHLSGAGGNPEILYRELTDL